MEQLQTTSEAISS